MTGHCNICQQPLSQHTMDNLRDCARENTNRQRASIKALFDAREREELERQLA